MRRRTLAMTAGAVLVTGVTGAALVRIHTRTTAETERLEGRLAEVRSELTWLHGHTTSDREEEIGRLDTEYRRVAAGVRRETLRFWLLRRPGEQVPVVDSLALQVNAAAEAARSADEEAAARAQHALADGSDLAERLAVLDQVGLPATLRRRIAEVRGELAHAAELARAGDAVQAAVVAERATAEARRAAEGVTALTGRFTAPERLAEWQSWVDETVAESRRSGGVALVVYKNEHRMTLYQAGRAVRSWDVDLGPNSLFDKVRQGDRATPEGRYRVARRRGRGTTRYYKALELDYPNAADRAAFARTVAAGLLPASTNPGGLIQIHGNGGRDSDWTDGCVAVPDADMDWLFERVPTGTPVTIVGSGGGEGPYTRADAVLRGR